MICLSASLTDLAWLHYMFWYLRERSAFSRSTLLLGMLRMTSSTGSKYPGHQPDQQRHHISASGEQASEPCIVAASDEVRVRVLTLVNPLSLTGFYLAGALHGGRHSSCVARRACGSNPFSHAVFQAGTPSRQGEAQRPHKAGLGATCVDGVRYVRSRSRCIALTKYSPQMAARIPRASRVDCAYQTGACRSSRCRRQRCPCICVSLARPT